MSGWGLYRPPTWQHPVGWNTLPETPPVITAPVVRERPSDFVFNGILRPAWAYRLELALIGLLWAGNHWLTGRLGAYDAAQVILALAIVVGLLNWTRDPLADALFRSHLRRLLQPGAVSPVAPHAPTCSCCSLPTQTSTRTATAAVPDWPRPGGPRPGATQRRVWPARRAAREDTRPVRR